MFDKSIKISSILIFITIIQYILVIIRGLIISIYHSFINSLFHSDSISSSYVSLLSGWDSFYETYIYTLHVECWNRPVISSPDTWIILRDRELVYSDTKKRYLLENKTTYTHAINFGSYNYLGYGGNNRKNIITSVVNKLNKYGISTVSQRSQLGNTLLLENLELQVAKFLKKESSLICGMGFGTNQDILSSLFDEGDLILSDSLNHVSSIVGCKLSSAKIKIFNHNDMVDLERILRYAICTGQNDRIGNLNIYDIVPWKKIVILVEGVYSMEGDAYLYVDEAHSIGALGATGRGIAEHFNIQDSNDIDILMGTFTKSFGSVGGYIAADANVITYLKEVSACYQYSSSISPAACQQVLCVLEALQTEAGIAEVAKLHENIKNFRYGLKKIGCLILGDDCSPVVPMLIGLPSKLLIFSRKCLERHLAVVMVGYPACSMFYPRTRFCISSAHTKEEIEYAVSQIDIIAEEIGLKYDIKTFG